MEKNDKNENSKDENKFYFMNFVDGIIKLTIMVIPFLYANFPKLLNNEYIGIRASLIFATFSSLYTFGKICIEHKNYKPISIPSIIAILLLLASLTLIVCAIAIDSAPPAPRLTTSYDVAAFYTYLAHLIIICIEIVRVVIRDLSNNKYINTNKQTGSAGISVESGAKV